MFNSSYHIKAKMRDIGNIESFASLYGIGMGNTFLFTVTFKNNITDKKTSSRYLNLLLTDIRNSFKILHYIAVCERQKRGAWHFHILCHLPSTSLKAFKRYVSRFISRSGKPFGFFHCKWTTGNSIKSVAKYLTKYLLKSEDREKGVRYVSYSRNWLRPWSASFSFAFGKVRDDWRLPCADLCLIYKNVFRLFYSSAGCERVSDLIKEYKSMRLDDFLLDNTLLTYFEHRSKYYFKESFSKTISALETANKALFDFFTFDAHKMSNKEKLQHWGYVVSPKFDLA